MNELHEDDYESGAFEGQSAVSKVPKVSKKGGFNSRLNGKEYSNITS